MERPEMVRQVPEQPENYMQDDRRHQECRETAEGTGIGAWVVLRWLMLVCAIFGFVGPLVDGALFLHEHFAILLVWARTWLPVIARLVVVVYGLILTWGYAQKHIAQT